MRTEFIDYAFEGTALRGYLAVEEGRSGVPGVLVAHDAGGLSDNMREKTRRVATLGYCAFALDCFGGGAPVSDGMARIGALTDPPKAGRHPVEPLTADFARWRGLASAGLEVLAKVPECNASRLAAVGYCFGGTTVYELARSGAELRGVVGFHSALAPSSGEARNIRGRVLALLGAQDPLIPPEARLAFEREMHEAGVNWEMTVYGSAGHAFTHPRASSFGRPGFFYEPRVDARSWETMRRFLEEIFASA